MTERCPLLGADVGDMISDVCRTFCIPDRLEGTRTIISECDEMEHDLHNEEYVERLSRGQGASRRYERTVYCERVGLIAIDDEVFSCSNE